MLLCTCAAALALLPALLALRVYLACKDQARLNAAERTIWFGPEGVRETDSLGNDLILAWVTFHSCEERAKYWLLYVTKQKFVIVPKSAFPAAEAERVSDLLRSKGLLS